jgi:WD40 repeat protein
VSTPAVGIGKPLVLRGHERPDGTRLVSAGADGTAQLWHADGNAESLILSGHESCVWSASFSPDATQVVSAGGTALCGCGVPTVPESR